MSKILTIDVEWKPTKAYVWRAFDENILPPQIIEDGGLLCVGCKWLGDKVEYLFSEWEHGHRGMLEMTHAMLEEADAVVTYNGDRYDVKKLNGEFLLHGLPPVPPPTSIDLIKTIKKMGYFMNRLAFIGPFLGVGSKLEHEGFALWTKVLDGDEKAQRKMERYCKEDVRVTERLYKRIRPFIDNHPHLGQHANECPNCGGKHLQSRGYRRTRMFRIQRLQCVDCGAWSTGTRSKIK